MLQGFSNFEDNRVRGTRCGTLRAAAPTIQNTGSNGFSLPWLCLRGHWGGRRRTWPCGGKAVCAGSGLRSIRSRRLGLPTSEVTQFNPGSRSYLNVVSDQTGQNYDTVIVGDVAVPFVAP